MQCRRAGRDGERSGNVQTLRHSRFEAINEGAERSDPARTHRLADEVHLKISDIGDR